jgi:two-component system cell cycle sensor histidine kinase/response regulator CckA
MPPGGYAPVRAETVELARLPLPAYVWKEVDGCLRFVDCNDAARTVEPAIDAMLGLTADELGDGGAMVAAALRAALDGKTVVSAEGEYTRFADGSVRWLRATYVYAPPATVIAHVEDATDKRREERLLRESNRRVRKTFEDSPLGKALISVTAEDLGVIVEVNGAFGRLFGLDPAELVGRVAPASLSHPDDAAKGLADISRLMDGEVASCHFEKRFLRADGGAFFAAVWVSLVTSDAGDPRYALCHFQDVTARHDAEAALRESEARYRQIVETTSEGVWLIDAEDRTTFVNGRMAEMLGYDVDEMLGEPLARFVAGPAPDIQAQLAHPHGVTEQREVELRPRDGSTLSASLSNDSLPTLDGEYAGALAMVSDITARRAEQEELREARARFEGAFECAPIGLALVRLDGEPFGEILRVNSAMCELLGFEADALVGRTASDITHPDDVEYDLAYARRLVSGEISSYQLDKRYLAANGETVLARLSASLVRNVDGSAAYGIAHVEDVRAQRRWEEEIEERERRFRAAFSTALDAMLICDDNRACLEGNTAAAELLGVPLDEIPRRSLDDFAVGDLAARVDGWRLFLDSGEMKGEFDIRRADGEIRHVEFSARANFMPGRHLSILRDVTERRRTAEEAVQLEAALHQTQKLETVGQLAGGVAHDFNNLLAVILHASEFALGELGDHPAADEVREISAAAERAAALTRQLLVFSRREIAQPRLIDLNELVANVERLLRRTIGEHIALAAELEGGLPAVRADPSHLEQVLLNLGVNARDAMPEGGVLTLQTSTVTLDEHYARLHADVEAGSYVRLSVSDTGTGMPEEVRARAFEPFFTTKPKGTGTGLGLASTYGVVKQNGGHVEIYSEPGRGTVVKLYLPAVRSPVQGAAVASPPAVGPQIGGRVLVVEDEEGVRRIIDRILTGHGYEVVLAANPHDALAADVAADLVVTDVVMPGMSGATLVERLREARPALPAIFMSGYTDQPDALPADAAFMSKPFSRETLLAEVAKALEGAQVGR